MAIQRANGDVPVLVLELMSLNQVVPIGVHAKDGQSLEPATALSKDATIDIAPTANGIGKMTSEGPARYPAADTPV